MTTCRICPSILNSDLGCLTSECQRMLDCGADYLHLDVMDGHFVPNLTFGHPVVKCLRDKIPDAYFDVHLMVSEPKKWIEGMADAGANQYTFHYEATDDHMEMIRKVKEAGMQVGVAVKPGTPVQPLEPLAEHINTALIMTVEPGFGGQKFMTDMMPKVLYLRQRYRDLNIQVDGGVGPSTIQPCAEAGANFIVSGSAVMKSPNPRETIQILRSAVDEAMQKACLER